ncbi:MAG: hypothetical protein E6Q89_06595 [Bacteroidia bacterium]|nr:MAG: hypothetical protein E6Q89_06595 [Bacteroidia bacterium]
MDLDEIGFIQRKHDKESKSYLYTMNRILIVIVIIPLLIGIFFSWNYQWSLQVLIQVYVIGFIALLLFFILIATLSYFYKLHKYKQDLKHQLKIIEQVIIQSCQFMPQNKSWHLYITSAEKLSIEVSEEFYMLNQPGDEINIEYAKYSKEYFGYF